MDITMIGLRVRRIFFPCNIPQHNPVMEIMLLGNSEPSNYEEAMAGPDSNKKL